MGESVSSVQTAFEHNIGIGMAWHGVKSMDSISWHLRGSLCFRSGRYQSEMGRYA